MRTMHLIESGHTGHTTTGLHSFFAITLHAAMVVAALYATTRTSVEREDAPDPRVYFVPSPRPAAPTPVVQTPRAPRASATIHQATPKIAPSTVAKPSTSPAVDVPLAYPSAAIAADPAPTSGEPTAPAGAGSGTRTGPYEVGEVEVPAAQLSKAGPE